MAAGQRLRVYMPNRESQGKILFELADVGPAIDHDGLRTQRCTLPDGDGGLHIVALTETGRERLRRQIKIGAHLAARNSGGTYPPQLSELRGYANETAIFSYSGQPLAGIELTAEEKASAARDLLSGLRGLSDAQVVHRGIRPDSLLWDGSILQITDYSLAAVSGSPEAAEPVDGPPWCSPELASGARPAAPADDLYSAALVLFWLHSGEEPGTDPASMRDRLRLQDPPLPELLAGCFDAEARRPTLRGLRERWTPPPPPRAPAHLRLAAEARAEFADLRRRQAQDRSPLIDPATAPALRPPRRPQPVPEPASFSDPSPVPAPGSVPAATPAPPAVSCLSSCLSCLIMILALVGLVALVMMVV